MKEPIQTRSTEPLESLDEWEDFLVERYPEPASAETAKKKPAVGTDPDKTKEEFRDYEANARDTVRKFYWLNHTKQTYTFVQEKHAQYLGLNNMEMGVWDALMYLNQLVDDSDPDTDLSQAEHLLQTAEGIRRDGHPRWMVLTGMMHDLGKILCLWGEPQWAVVGDTFPVGCAFSDKNVFPEFFEHNPDFKVETYQTENGVYEPGCGFDNVKMSWGHDEYIYNVCKDYLPKEGLAMLRYHSFYPWHREGAYKQFENDHDREMLPWVLKFNEYDLYTKSHGSPAEEELRPYYEELIAEFFPAKIRW